MARLVVFVEDFVGDKPVRSGREISSLTWLTMNVVARRLYFDDLVKELFDEVLDAAAKMRTAGPKGTLQ